MYDGVVRLPYERLQPQQGNTTKHRVLYALGFTGWLLFVVAGVYAMSQNKALEADTSQHTSSVLSTTSVEDTTAGQSPDPTSSSPTQGLSIEALSLSLDCPALEDAFNKAPPGSMAPFVSFPVVKGENCAYVAVHLTKFYLPPGGFAVLRAVEGSGVDDSMVHLSENFPSGSFLTNVLTAPVLGKEIRLELYRSSHSNDTNVSDAQCFGLEADSYARKPLSAVMTV